MGTGQEKWYDVTLKTIATGTDGGDPSRLPAGTEDRRPDIFGQNDHELYEIKSAKTGAAKAVARATLYVTALKKACVDAKLGAPGARGTSGTRLLGGKEYIWSSPVAGAIIYTSLSTLPPELKPFPVPGPLPEGDPALNPEAAAAGQGAVAGEGAVAVGETAAAGEAAGGGFEALDLLYVALGVFAF